MLGAFSILLFPLLARAGFWSSFLGDEAEAYTNNTVAQVEFSNNSQTMELLATNAQSTALFQEKKDQKGKQARLQNGQASSGAGKKDDKSNEIDLNISVNILSDNALLSATSPMGAFGGSEYEGASSLQVSIYVVRRGDSISQVADMFGVTVDTILSANDMKKGDKIKEGDVLLILPFSGVEHTVIKGQTLQGISNLYKVDIEEILLANDIEAGAKIVVGEKLIIPGAGMLAEVQSKTAKTISKTAAKSGSYSDTSGYFKHPLPGSRRTRGIKPGHQGVDMAAPMGTPIRAAASGTVLIARNGYNGGFGNYVVIQHPNGTKTLYGHMSKLGTSPGAQVSQGDVIGYVGSTGRSTGPHLHFEVLRGKNPF